MRAGRRRPPRAVATVRRALWRGSHHPLPVVRGSARVASGFVRVLDATASRSPALLHLEGRPVAVARLG